MLMICVKLRLSGYIYTMAFASVAQGKLQKTKFEDC